MRTKGGRGEIALSSPASLWDAAAVRTGCRRLLIQFQNLPQDFGYPLLIPEAQGIHQPVALGRVIDGGSPGDQMAEQVLIGYVQSHDQPFKAFHRQIFLAPFHLADIGRMEPADFRQPLLTQMELCPAIAQPLPKCGTNIAHFHITQIYTINRLRRVKQTIDILCA